MRAVLDSSILIDAIRGESRAVGYVGSLAVHAGGHSVVTLCELLPGAIGERAEREMEEFLQPLQLCEANGEIARAAGKLRRRWRGLSTEDAIIAATAIVHHAVLVTRDRDHFGIEGLEVVTP